MGSATGPERAIASGAEHRVAQTLDGTRVVKHTYGGFGFTMDAEIAPFGGVLNLRQALPSEYLARLDLTNEVFGDDLRFEGFSRIDEQIGFAISQPVIAGRHATLSEVSAWLREHGFEQVLPERIDNDYIRKTTWWQPAAHLLIGDAKPKNFILDRTGQMIPIDLLVVRVIPGSGVDRVLRWGF